MKNVLFFVSGQNQKLSEKLASAGVCTNDPRCSQDNEDDATYDNGGDAYHVTPSLVIAQTLFDPVFS